MAYGIVLKPSKNFRDNARLLLPVLLADFLLHTNRVVFHPRLKSDLHAMRLAGKTLRYAMEVFEEAFDDEFSMCLKDVKQLLDLMGRVHDSDVNIPVLLTHLHEMRSFNRATEHANDRIKTTALINLIRQQQKNRVKMYNEVCAVINRWTREDFKQRIVHSMTRV